MTLTVTTNTNTANWTAELSEADLTAALMAGLAALYPGQVPEVDFAEEGDRVLVKNTGTLAFWSGGSNTMTVEITDVSPAA